MLMLMRLADRPIRTDLNVHLAVQDVPVTSRGRAVAPHPSGGRHNSHEKLQKHLALDSHTSKPKSKVQLTIPTKSLRVVH